MRARREGAHGGTTGPAYIDEATLLEGGVEGVEGDAVGAVPDCMDRDLEAGTDPLVDHLVEALGCDTQQAGPVGGVAVRLQQRRAPAAERAVQE